MTDTEVAIMASIAAENVLRGATLTPSDVEVMLAYVNKANSLSANQKRVWKAVLESHERLRTERIINHYGL